MRCRVPILLCALLLCSAAVGTPVAAQQEQLQSEGTHFDVQLQADGDATWNVTVAIPIAGDDERDDFEAFAARFEAGERGLDLGGDAFEQAVAEADAASERDMSLSPIRRDSEIVNVTDDEAGEVVEQYGVLRLRFTWESFARVAEDGAIHVDDAFNTTDGTWLSGLAADQSLTIRPPPEYGSPTTSPIGAEEGNLQWEGPATFEPGYFTIVYHPTPTPEPPEGASTPLVVGALVLSGAALVLGVYLLVARRRGESSADEDETAATASTTAANAPATGAADEDAGGGAPPPVESGADADSETDAGDDAVDLDLLSDEERVERLLEQNGGRMKQATIVKETGWSNAKVSQLLSSMDEAGQIDKLRIGRENLISLPDEGVGELDDVSDS
jgi:hypothetical protein